jgi:mono/diheme cytochrome c family protein
MAKRASERQGRRSPRKGTNRRPLAAWLLAAWVVGSGAYVAYVATSDSAVSYSSIEDHFKYGSTGAERTVGIPYPIFRVLPTLFASYLPGEGYASLGFIEERGRDVPVGFSRRYFRGLDRVGLNCGACHVGRLRDTPEGDARVLIGMPANTADLGAFQRFLFDCAADERFTPEMILAAIDEADIPLGPLDWLRLRYVEIYRVRELLLKLRQRLEFIDEHPQTGPGRVDTITATKSLLGFELGDRYERPIGTVDFAAVWLQKKKAGMSLYWDGSNDSMEERHLLGAVHTGAIGTADLDSVQRIRMALEEEAPPPYPYGFEASIGEQGAVLYGRYCAECHGLNGREFRVGEVGAVTPLPEIGTDPDRVRVYTEEVAEGQRKLSADNRVRFERFTKTDGYANVPLDGLWLRAPYLHNGSVPTLRDLLEPSNRRPPVFFRGDDVYDPQNVGFTSDVAERDGRRLFVFYTALPGNSNRGHEGRRYGTQLSPFEKDALVEYLKTF